MDNENELNSRNYLQDLRTLTQHIFFFLLHSPVTITASRIYCCLHTARYEWVNIVSLVD